MIIINEYRELSRAGSLQKGRRVTLKSHLASVADGSSHSSYHVAHIEECASTVVLIAEDQIG